LWQNIFGHMNLNKELTSAQRVGEAYNH
jgi:hypothetical protein